MHLRWCVCDDTISKKEETTYRIDLEMGDGTSCSVHLPASLCYWKLCMLMLLCLGFQALSQTRVYTGSTMKQAKKPCAGRAATKV
jgi:hypothetical protein